MGTFRKFFFILGSRRPEDRMLVDQETVGIIDQKILSYSPTVKEKNSFGNGPPFRIQIDDLHWKYCILRENSKKRGFSKELIHNFTVTVNSNSEFPA